MQRPEAQEIVTLLYRGMLGREPDAEGFAKNVDALVAGHSVVALIRSFVQSPELADKQRLLRPNLTGFPAFADKDIFAAPDVVDALFTKTATYWRNTASKPEEIYWSVLTEKNWNRALTTADRREFVRTGAAYADRVLGEFVRRTGRPTAGLCCLDFGCGVGRLAINFASRVAEVRAVDFSSAHLAELRANADLHGCADKISTWLLQMPADLDKVPRADLVYSLVALQHNTPTVIASVMESLLRHLEPGGLAFLHVTLAKAGYSGFTIDGYLRDPAAGTTMEVHFLPRTNIEQVAQRAGCEILASNCVGGNYYAYSEELIFRRRDGA